MKYMNFNSSCSYCCIANLLEAFGVDKEDKDIAIEMGLPYLFRYSINKDYFYTGSQVQDSYNLYLNTIGFNADESIIKKEDSIDFIKNNIPCMIGLVISEYGKHACVFKGIKGNKYMFLNPHRENDGLEDYFEFTENEVINVLSDENHILVINKISEIKKIDIYEYKVSLNYLDIYKKKFYEFCINEQSPLEIFENRDRLFRPLVIDLLAMMQIIEENALIDKLKDFRVESLNLIKSSINVIPNSIIDLKLFDDIINDYKLLISKYINNLK